jgi:hypothetical protein
VDRRERQQILGEWGVRGESLRERNERLVLEADLHGSPLAGKPLPRRARNFRPAVDSYLLSLGGPASHMRRLREIELEIVEHERRLERAWRELARRCAKEPAGFTNLWRRVAARWRFDAVNELIARHNLYYPAESRLPMDPRTGDFALVGGRHYRRDRLDADWVLERFPPVLEHASR